MRDERRAEEARCALLVDDEIACSRRKLLLDVIKLLALGAHLAVRRAHAAGIGVARGVDDGKPGLAGGGQELAGWLDRLPGMLAAGAAVARIDFAHGTVAALIGLVVEVDRQQRGIASDAHLATIGL